VNLPASVSDSLNLAAWCWLLCCFIVCSWGKSSLGFWTSFTLNIRRLDKPFKTGTPLCKSWTSGQSSMWEDSFSSSCSFSLSSSAGLPCSETTPLAASWRSPSTPRTNRSRLTPPSMIMKYKIVAGGLNPKVGETLESKVQSLIDEGWICQGGPFTCENHSDAYQAMVRKLDNIAASSAQITDLKTEINYLNDELSEWLEDH
jgi:hypothetical protein